MKHAVLGTGTVGQAIATRLVSLGHTVCLGSRTPDNPTAAAWAEAHAAHHDTFAGAAADAEVVWLAVKGEHAIAVAVAASESLHNTVLLDLTNPLDFSQGFPPRLFVCNDDSLGEQIQRAVPHARVVKTLNTLANALMVAPERLPEPTEVFVAGNDPEARETAVRVLQELGHPAPIDMGGLDAARALEAWLLLWTRLYGRFGTDAFNLRLVRGAPSLRGEDQASRSGPSQR